MKSLLWSIFLLISINCFSQKIEEATLFIQGIDDVESELKWTENGYVYDKPVMDMFVINSLNEDVYKLIVFNSFGEKMFYQEDLDSLISVDVSTLTQGTYYVVLTGDKYRKSFKFTKV